MASTPKLLTVIAWLLILGVVAACSVFTIGMTTEHYGAGPPYYGRTTNMDKWSSPVLPIVLVNTGGIAAIAATLLVARARRRRRERS